MTKWKTKLVYAVLIAYVKEFWMTQVAAAVQMMSNSKLDKLRKNWGNIVIFFNRGEIQQGYSYTNTINDCAKL